VQSIRQGLASRYAGWVSSTLGRMANERPAAGQRAPVIVVHGGAGSIPDDMLPAYEAGVRAASGIGWGALAGGGSAVDAVEAAIASMEDAGIFDAGRGSVLNQDGRVQLDAMIMDGATLALGAIAAVETVRNPIRVARAVMERASQVYFVGEGAERFATAQGFEPIDNDWLISDRERRRFEAALAGDGERGTVGAVALDAGGNLAAGTSTGGMRHKPAGRVGDSSVVGAGGYADNELAAVSCTGDGEAFMRLVLGKWAVDQVGSGRSPQEAADLAIQRLTSRLGARGGLIIVDMAGRVGAARNAQRMAWAVRSTDEDRAEVASGE
jgi:beta-aspartyl-peptidase (threonine type)